MNILAITLQHRRQGKWPVVLERRRSGELTQGGEDGMRLSQQPGLFRRRSVSDYLYFQRPQALGILVHLAGQVQRRALQLTVATAEQIYRVFQWH